MVKAIRASRPGGIDVLSWDDVEVGDPGAGELRLRHTAIGVNFIDTYHRKGTYPGSTYPVVLGVEGAGVVEAVGPGVSAFKAGDRVAYALARGSYAEARLVPETALVKVPEGISDDQAAAGITKGVTVHHLFTRVRQVQKGDWVLYHAAAGGVGLIACQWARAIGAKLIGTVSTDDKAKLAKEHGAAETIVYTRENFVDRVKAITGGAGAALVIDGVGAATQKDSVKCLATYGTLTTIGQASGPSDLAIADLPPSTYFTKGSIATLVPRPAELRASAAAFFDMVLRGAVRIDVNHRFALKDAAQAHAALEGRQTTGSIILKP